jgi:hypothetical protein
MAALWMEEAAGERDGCRAALPFVHQRQRLEINAVLKRAPYVYIITVCLNEDGADWPMKQPCNGPL